MLHVFIVGRAPVNVPGVWCCYGRRSNSLDTFPAYKLPAPRISINVVLWDVNVLEWQRPEVLSSSPASTLERITGRTGVVVESIEYHSGDWCSGRIRSIEYPGGD